MKHFKTVTSSAVVGLSMLALGGALFGLSSARTPSTGEKIYEQDAFSQEYSRGVVFWSEGRSNMTKEFSSKLLSESICEHIDKDSDPANRKDAVCYDNHQKESDVYYTVKNGAVMNNQLLDVRVYPWVELNEGDDTTDHKGYWGTYANTGEGETNVAGINFPSSGQTGINNISTGKTTTRIIHLEYHFYRPGTTEEVSFKGVIGTTDLDSLEGLDIIQGYHQGFVASDTDLSFTEFEDEQSVTHHTWAGTDRTEGKTVFRAEVEGTSSKPLKIDYIVRTGLGTNFWANANTVAYNITNLPQGTSAPETDIVAHYGTYAPSAAPTVTGYTFDGWYKNANFTEKVTGTIMVTEDTILYGKFTQNMNTVKYEVADAPDDYKKPDDVTIAENSTYTPAETPKIDGYNFDGWYLDKEMTKKADETITVDDDIILYGKFSKKAVPVIPDTGVNSQNENSSSSNQADLI
ncbi:InlB B-repeat-containing protein, partial [Candidatus Saccharibacteria bacterium]|nr:InlB B-repeat-containing protein [Candidatus Saccharibacteria bacterium]